MKFITQKVIKGNTYNYLYYDNYSKNLGTSLPHDLKKQLISFFHKISHKQFNKLPKSTKDHFPYGNLQIIEESHYWYICLSQSELFQKEHQDFIFWFAILFTYNSNRAEGSKVTRPEIEKFAKSRVKKPKTKTDREIFNSLNALEFAFSNKMKWNLKHIKKIHKLLLTNLDDPLTVGKWKNENNTAPANQPTTNFKEVPKAMKKLLEWYHKETKKKQYPPLLAVKFYLQFEKIHPFLDGNGRVGRILLNSILHKYKYMPIIFFTQNHTAHCEAIRQALEGREKKLIKNFIDQTKKTFKKIHVPTL